MRRLRGKIHQWLRSLDRKLLRPGYESGTPAQINIETAGACNLHCSCCPHGAAPGFMRQPGLMSVDTFHRVLEHIDIPVKLAYLHLHGEPFLNPNLPLFVKELTEKEIAVNLYSNCTAVDPEKLDAILDAKRVAVTFSADILDKEYYEGIRVGACYEETLSKLDIANGVFARHRKFFNMVIVLDGCLKGKLDEIVTRCEQLYGRYSQLNGILLGSRFPWPRLPWTGDLDGHLRPGHHRCPYALEGLSVLWNGDATMCSFDYTGECIVGSMLDSTYRELLNNNDARRFRALHWRHRDKKHPLCADCLLDRYTPASVSLHRTGFLKKDYDEKKRIVGEFFQ